MQGQAGSVGGVGEASSICRRDWEIVGEEAPVRGQGAGSAHGRVQGDQGA